MGSDHVPGLFVRLVSADLYESGCRLKYFGTDSDSSLVRLMCDEYESKHLLTETFVSVLNILLKIPV